MILCILWGYDAPHMARPLRIQYQDAYYHVMNRGRNRERIFHGSAYYQAFLLSVQEAHVRFGVTVHAYCLMPNHYHLFVSTPRGNLDRVMRHINGVYTQRHNRLKGVDGPLFRGRYKAILVEAEAYALQLSRYIHRNPLAKSKRGKDTLAEYPWSSYPGYVNRVPCPKWVSRDLVYELLDAKRPAYAYKQFVERNIDDELEEFYGKARVPPVLGSEAFVRAMAPKEAKKRRQFNQVQGRLPRIDEIVAQVAKQFGVTKESIIQARRGRGSANVPRWIALYLCRELGGGHLREICQEFGLGHISGVSQAAVKVKQACQHDRHLARQVKLLFHYLTP